MVLSREVTIKLQGKEGFSQNTCCNVNLSPLPCALLPLSLSWAVAAGNRELQGILFLPRDLLSKGLPRAVFPRHLHKHG